jgi:hypothetical protein
MRNSTLTWPTKAALALSLPTKELLARLAVVFVMFFALWLGLAPLFTVPAVVPANAPAAQFSAARARQDLTFVAAEPRPIGSRRNAAVRDYLVNQIRALGLEPQVQQTVLNEFSPIAGSAQIVAVENVLVRIPGTASRGAILVEGHYDSVPTGLGASDCGACTVTVLEALRAIQAGPPLQNDVIFLFADGEEVGIAGATAFIQQHAWAQDVALSLVFEALGTRGASMLYTTSSESGYVVDQALTAAPYPLASSFVNDLMWNGSGNSGSDLDALIADGRAGLAFVYLSLDGAPAYHTRLDSVTNLDVRSLQHHGEQAVSLVRHFGNLPLDSLPRQPNAVTFALLPYFVVHYPGAWALPLALLAVMLWLGVLILGLWRRTLHIGGLLIGMAAFLVSLIATVTVVTLTWWLLRLFNTNLHIFLVGGLYAGPLYLLAFVVLTLAIVAAFHALWRRWFATADLTMGALAWWAVLALWTANSLTGFSYLFTWPLLVAVLVQGWAFLWPAAAQRSGPQALGLSSAAVATLLLMAMPVYFLAVLGARFEALVGLPLAALPLPFVVLALGLLLPQIEWLSPARRWQLPVGALVVSGALLMLATFTSGFDAAHPKPNLIAYLLDQDRQEAHWLTLNDSRLGRGTAAQLDEWTGQFFPNGSEETQFNPWLSGLSFGQSFPALQTAAPVVDLPGATVRVLAEQVDNGIRTLRLQIDAPPAGVGSYLLFEATGPVQVKTLNDTQVAGTPAPGNTVQVSIIGRPAGSVTLELTAPATGPVQVTVQDRYLGLPAIPGQTITPRPEWIMPAPFNDITDSTIVRHTVVLVGQE